MSLIKANFQATANIFHNFCAKQPKELLLMIACHCHSLIPAIMQKKKGKKTPPKADFHTLLGDTFFFLLFPVALWKAPAYHAVPATTAQGALIKLGTA